MTKVKEYNQAQTNKNMGIHTNTIRNIPRASQGTHTYIGLTECCGCRLGSIADVCIGRGIFAKLYRQPVGSGSCTHTLQRLDRADGAFEFSARVEVFSDLFQQILIQCGICSHPRMLQCFGRCKPFAGVDGKKLLDKISSWNTKSLVLDGGWRTLASYTPSMETLFQYRSWNSYRA